MPEGDSVAGHARLLTSVLLDRRLLSVGGTSPSVRKHSNRIRDAVVQDVRSIGKNLMIDLSTGYSVRVHLGMSGRWLVAPIPTEPHGSARLVLATEGHCVACFGAPAVEVDRTPLITARVAGLGPDLLGDFDEREFLTRARAVPHATIGELLLDQRVLAGIGNVYKSELLFLEKTDPWVPAEAVTDDLLVALAKRGRKLLAANVGPKPRSTTGWRSRGQETWVYGRAGLPCRRCGARIAQKRQGDRVTYWCPVCQPAGQSG